MTEETKLIVNVVWTVVFYATLIAAAVWAARKWNPAVGIVAAIAGFGLWLLVAWLLGQGIEATRDPGTSIAPTEAAQEADTPIIRKPGRYDCARREYLRVEGDTWKMPQIYGPNRWTKLPAYQPGDDWGDVYEGGKTPTRVTEFMAEKAEAGERWVCFNVTEGVEVGKTW